MFFIETGETLGERMIAEHGLKAGDHVFTPVEFPEAVYAVQRHEGVNNAITAMGGTTEILGTGTDHSEALNIMVQYLLGHPETKAVIGLGSTPTSVAVRAVEEAGLDIPVGGYDIIPEILDKTVIDRMLEIDVIEAYEVSKVLARQGIFVGQSCGAYLLGAKNLAEELKTGHIVTVFNDIGERYFSTSMWD